MLYGYYTYLDDINFIKCKKVFYFSQKSADIAVFLDFFGKRGNFEFFKKYSEFVYLDNWNGFSGHKLPKIDINMSYLFHLSQKNDEKAIFLTFFGKNENFEYFEK